MRLVNLLESASTNDLSSALTLHKLSQIIASLTRERIAEREADIHNSLQDADGKDNAVAKCRVSLRAWSTKKPMLYLHAVAEEDHTFEDEDESGMRQCIHWEKIFEARAEGERHLSHETILDYVQRALDDTRSKKYPQGVREGWISLPIYRSGSMCLRMVLFPHTSLRAGPFSFSNLPLTTTKGLIVRSPDTLRPFTLSL